MFATAKWWLLRLAVPATTRITFAGGEARLAKGRAPAPWLADCGAIATELGIVRGALEVVRRPGGPVLRFSPDVPPSSHQRFRNVFGVHRAKW